MPILIGGNSPEVHRVGAAHGDIVALAGSSRSRMGGTSDYSLVAVERQIAALRDLAGARSLSSMCTYSKEQLEETQVNRFLGDYSRSATQELATRYAKGDDPPDFVLTRPDGATVGLECTQLVIGDRIHAWSSVQKLKKSLLAVNRHTLCHLRGHTVYLTVNTPSGLPPAGSRGTKEVTEVLRAFRPAANYFVSLPEDLSGTNIIQAFGDYTVTAVGQADFPVTPFARRMDFDLALAIQSDVYTSTAWASLAERVREKDLPGNDAILVSCGAPVRRGLSFPSDDLAAAAIMQSAATYVVPATAHARAVYVHSWATERIVRLLPGKLGAQRLT